MGAGVRTVLLDALFLGALIGLASASGTVDPAAQSPSASGTAAQSPEPLDQEECKPDQYGGTFEAERFVGARFQDLPGFTRAVYERDHALITPESRVYASLPGWKNALGAVLVSPSMQGAHFTMTMVQLLEDSEAGRTLKGVERLVFVLNGTITLTEVTGDLGVSGFAYFPADTPGGLLSAGGARMLMFERVYVPPPEDQERPQFQSGVTEELPNVEAPGEVFRLRKLLPSTWAYDFNVYIMDFSPGEHLNVKEVHYNQHGMMLLEGKGIQRLGDKWYPVQAGDAIYMAPFVPQWYAALGDKRTRYILYKDTARDPLLRL